MAVEPEGAESFPDDSERGVGGGVLLVGAGARWDLACRGVTEEVVQDDAFELF